MKRTIYDLFLHETMHIEEDGGWDIMRVPGGWIYEYDSGKNDSKIFIPFNNEFNRYEEK